MKLKAKKDFNHQGRQHKAGEELEMPDHEAKQHIDAGNVEESQKPGGTGQQQQGGGKPPDR